MPRKCTPANTCNTVCYQRSGSDWKLGNRIGATIVVSMISEQIADNGEAPGITVGVLDDDRWAGGAIANWINGHNGYRVLWCATDAAVAMEQCLRPQLNEINAHRTTQTGRQSAIRPNVLVVDLSLGGIPGTQVCAEIRRSSSAIGLVCITARKPDSYFGDVVASGAQALIGKDRITTDILPALQAAAQGRSSQPELFADAQTSHELLAASGNHHFLPLNATEKSILSLFAQGLSPAQVMTKLGMERNTLYTHCHRALRKLHAKTRAEALIICERYGLLTA